MHRPFIVCRPCFRSCTAAGGDASAGSEQLRQLPAGVSEVAVHPAIVYDGLRGYGGAYIDERTDELAVVLDPRVRDAIEEEKIELASFTVFHDG